MTFHITIEWWQLFGLVLGIGFCWGLASEFARRLIRPEGNGKQ